MITLMIIISNTIITIIVIIISSVGRPLRAARWTAARPLYSQKRFGAEHVISLSINRERERMRDVL